MTKGFLVAVQFLTRFDIGRHNDIWSEENCGRSVKFFPLVGALLGAAYFAAASLMQQSGVFPQAVTAALLLVLTIILTGGIFFDGFMDSADGIFSGRDREKCLEIMKDSRVGANAVMAFGAVLLTEWAALFSLLSVQLPKVLFVIPIIGRFVTVIAIVMFPYARPSGLGKAFHDFADKKTTLAVAFITTIVCLLPLGLANVTALTAGLIGGVFFCRHACHVLGGLTGDTYGAATIIAECTAMVTFAVR